MFKNIGVDKVLIFSCGMLFDGCTKWERNNKKNLNFKKIKNILSCECFWKMTEKEINFYIK